MSFRSVSKLNNTNKSNSSGHVSQIPRASIGGSTSVILRNGNGRQPVIRRKSNSDPISSQSMRTMSLTTRKVQSVDQITTSYKKSNNNNNNDNSKTLKPLIFEKPIEKPKHNSTVNDDIIDTKKEKIDFLHNLKLENKEKNSSKSRDIKKSNSLKLTINVNGKKTDKVKKINKKDNKNNKLLKKESTFILDEQNDKNQLSPPSTPPPKTPQKKNTILRKLRHALSSKYSNKSSKNKSNSVSSSPEETPIINDKKTTETVVTTIEETNLLNGNEELKSTDELNITKETKVVESPIKNVEIEMSNEQQQEAPPPTPTSPIPPTPATPPTPPAAAAAAASESVVNSLTSIKSFNEYPEVALTTSDLGIKALIQNESIDLLIKEETQRLSIEPNDMKNKKSLFDHEPYWFANLKRVIDEQKEQLESPLPDNILMSDVTSKPSTSDKKSPEEQENKSENDLSNQLPPKDPAKTDDTIEKNPVPSIINYPDNILNGIEGIFDKFTKEVEKRFETAIENNLEKVIENVTNNIKQFLLDRQLPIIQNVENDNVVPIRMRNGIMNGVNHEESDPESVD